MLNDEEIQMAVAGRYLKGVHALVATPDMALALMSLPDSPLSFQVCAQDSGCTCSVHTGCVHVAHACCACMGLHLAVVGW